MESLAAVVIVICLVLASIGGVFGGFIGFLAARDQWKAAAKLLAFALTLLAALVVYGPGPLVIWPAAGLICAFVIMFLSA